LSAENFRLYENQRQVHAEVGQLHMCVERLVAAGQRAEDERRQVMFMSDVQRIVISNQTFIVSMSTLRVANPSKLWSAVELAARANQPAFFPERNAVIFAQILQWFQHLNESPAMVRAASEFKQFTADKKVLNELWEFGLEGLFCDRRAAAPVELAEVEVSNPIAANQFYVIGGHVGGSEGHQLNTINVYNPETGMWTQPLPPLPRRTHDHAAAMVDGVLFVVGGRTETGGELESGYKLSADNQWEDIPKMREPRFGHCCVSLGGMLYTLGGWHEEKLKSCERFDAADQSWHPIAAMNHSRCGSAGVVLDGKIYMIGGWSAASREADRIEDMKKMEVYDPETNMWEEGPMMNKGREGMCSVVHDGKIYIVGGVDSNEEPLQCIEYFDPATQLWKTLPVQLPDEHGRGLGGCASIKGKIYIAGGFIGDKVAASGWEFDPATGCFVPIAHLPSAAERFAVVGTST